MTGSSPEADPGRATSPVPPLMLLLVRHAEQATMLEFDPDLSDRGREQAELLGERLASLPVTAVVASPMRRAQQTAAPLARRLGLEVETEPDIDEIRMSAQEMRARFSRTSARTMEPDPDDYTSSAMGAVRVVPRFVWPTGGEGESGDDLRARATTALDAVIARHPGGVVVCVAHGGLISAALGSWLGITKDMWFVPWHTGISAVVADGDQRTLLGVNDASHLAVGQDILGLVSTSLELL